MMFLKECFSFRFRVRVTMGASIEKGHRKLCLDPEGAVRCKGRCTWSYSANELAPCKTVIAVMEKGKAGRIMEDRDWEWSEKVSNRAAV